jgi:glycosyltransferase involved in cell wall biosynthesis
MLVWCRCAERRINHIHVHFANVAADVALLATDFGASAGGPRTWSFTMHGPTEFLDVEAHRLPQKASDAAFVACISDFARSQLMALIDAERWERLHIVHCGIHPGPPPPERTTGDGPPHLLSVGQLLPRKGHGVLIQALAELAAEGVEIRATIVGAGPERGRLEDMTRGLGIADRVQFTGALGQDELPALYGRAQIFCLASFAEGVPVVLMEAMAHGVPVVATRIAGIPELVADGETGLLVAPGRAADLAAAIRRLAEDPELAARLGSAGREKVATDYDQAESAVQLKALFETAGGA